LQALPVKLPITFASTSAKLQAIPLASSYYSAKKCSMNMHQGHAAMTRRKDMQQVPVAWACSMDKQHGHAALTLAWTCGVYIKQGHESKHFKDMQNRHAARTQDAAWLCIIDMGTQKGHTSQT
jgi:hypothetical protein